MIISVPERTLTKAGRQMNTRAEYWRSALFLIIISLFDTVLPEAGLTDSLKVSKVTELYSHLFHTWSLFFVL